MQYAEGCCWIRAAFEGFGFAVAARQPCGHALSCKTARVATSYDNLVWSHPGAVNDYDHCGV